MQRYTDRHYNITHREREGERKRERERNKREERYFRIHSPKWKCLHQVPLLRAKGTSRKRNRDSIRARKEGEKSSSELTETEGACTGPAWVYITSSAHIMWVPV